MLKGLIAIYKMRGIMRKYPAIVQCVKQLLKFIEEAHKQQKPIVTELILVNMADGSKYSDFISLWAGMGNANVIDRAKSLKAQNTELKRLLQIVRDGKMNDDEMEQVKLVLQYFD